MINQSTQSLQKNTGISKRPSPDFDEQLRKKDDALELAALIYRIYIETKNSAIIKNGQYNENVS